MPSKIKENVYPNISQLKLRPLTVHDFREFRLSILESKESMSTFLNMGIELPDLNVIDFMNNYNVAKFKKSIGGKYYENAGLNIY